MSTWTNFEAIFLGLWLLRRGLFVVIFQKQQEKADEKKFFVSVNSREEAASPAFVESRGVVTRLGEEWGGLEKSRNQKDANYKFVIWNSETINMFRGEL